MTITLPLTMEALMERVHKHLRVEEDGAKARAKYGTIVISDKKTSSKVNTVGKRGRPNYNNRGGPPNDKDTKARKLKVRTAITTVFKKSMPNWEKREGVMTTDIGALSTTKLGIELKTAHH